MRWKYFTGRGTSRPSQNLPAVAFSGLIWHEGRTPTPFFWKCVKRKGFKSFVLKVCETKGVADAFLLKCVKRKSLASICSLSTPWKKPSGKPWRRSLAGPTAAPGDYDKSTYSRND